MVEVEVKISKDESYNFDKSEDSLMNTSTLDLVRCGREKIICVGDGF